ncbi:VapA family S-layer protein [Vibrio vulnificus]|uniref:VapA family S-layer protein n=1 Tax=Vibrio vulnificus TaxID=672 RepID=UPI000927CE67|nr:cell surface protein [Vibrio vulnificus]OJI53484.1 S-layer protein precursor [Vibrio vulnificus]OJI57941.1 S-layer protein precursor [Vibrio fluvialis]POB26678.1 cell surface protein [Vibrio vulnificus]
MLKKTLLAASVAAFAAAPAMADVNLSYGGLTTPSNTITTTTLAAVTKQAVLSFSTAEDQIAAEFDVNGDLKQNGFITIELTGDATFNDNEVRQWLTGAASNDGSIQIDLEVATATAVNGVVQSGSGVPATEAELAKVFKFIDVAGGVQVDYAIDLDGKRLRLALAQTVGSADDMIQLSTSTAVDADVNAAAIAAGLAANSAALTTAGVVGATDGTNETAPGNGDGTVGYLFADVNGTATTDAQKVAYIRGLGATGVTYLEGLAGFATGDVTETLVGAGTEINFDFKNANQIFNLKSGANNDVAVKIGALKNASYSADPVQSGKVFQLGDLFELGLTESGKATALVSTGFLRVDTNDDTVIDDNNIAATGYELYNRTSNQNIQLNKVNLTLTGDLSAFRSDLAGNLLHKDGTASGWKLNAAKTAATAKAGDAVLQGQITLDAAASSVNALWSNFSKLYVETTNDMPVEAQKISVTASIAGADQDTFEDFSDTLADLFIITRDGLKFDTILTGTTSSNTVHIRDVSGILPQDGGKIFVTVWEYDAHEAGENAQRNVLAERKELAVKLPSNGAVTLSPATIAAQLGIEVAPARQARMLFEVETNVGEVAVKKSDGKGTDIQVGSQAAEKDIVDFTL